MNLCLKFTDLESEIPYLKSMLKKSSKQVHKSLVEKFVQIIANYCKLKNEGRFEIILH